MQENRTGGLTGSGLHPQALQSCILDEARINTYLNVMKMSHDYLIFSVIIFCKTQAFKIINMSTSISENS